MLEPCAPGVAAPDGPFDPAATDPGDIVDDRQCEPIYVRVLFRPLEARELVDDRVGSGQGIVVGLRVCSLRSSRGCERDRMDRDPEPPPSYELRLASQSPLDLIGRIVLPGSMVSRVGPFDQIEGDDALVLRYPQGIDSIRPRRCPGDRISDEQPAGPIRPARQDVDQLGAGDGLAADTANDLDAHSCSPPIAGSVWVRCSGQQATPSPRRVGRRR